MELRDFITATLLILGSILITECHAADRCIYVENGYYYQMYCSSGCCGDLYNAYCCWSSGIIVGIVVGSICFIAFIAIIVLCVVHYKKKNKRQVRTVTVTGASHLSQAAVVVPPPYIGYAPPPNYESQSQPGQNPAYPPPAYQMQTMGTGPFSYMPYSVPPPGYQPNAAAGWPSTQQTTNQNAGATIPTAGQTNQNPFSVAARRTSHVSSNRAPTAPMPNDHTSVLTPANSSRDELPQSLSLRTGGRVSLPPIGTTTADNT